MAHYYQMAYLDSDVTNDTEDLSPKEELADLAVLRMDNQKPVRIGSTFRVAYLGSYVTKSTQDWPLGEPTDLCTLRSLIQDVRRGKEDSSQNFDGWLSVRASGLRLSLAGKATEFDISMVEGSFSTWPTPSTLILEEGAGYITDHFPALFKLVIRPKKAEDTLRCHLILCKKKSDADALVDLVDKKLHHGMQLRRGLALLAVECGISIPPKSR